MLLKVIFLTTICIPIAYLQYHLLTDAAKDLKQNRKITQSAGASRSYDDYLDKQYYQQIK